MSSLLAELDRIVSIPNFLTTANPLLILNLSVGSTFEDVKQSYRRLSQIFHPDKHVNSSMPRHVAKHFPHGANVYEEVFKLLVNSYKLLEDPDRLSLYSKELESMMVAKQQPQKRKSKRRKATPVFADHDTPVYKEFSSACTFLLNALNEQQIDNQWEIISKIKASVSIPRPAKDVTKLKSHDTVDEFSKTNKTISTIDEEVSKIDSKHCNNGLSPTTSRKRECSMPEEVSVSKKRKIEQSNESQDTIDLTFNIPSDNSYAAAFSSLSALLQALPPEIRRPL